LPKQQPEENSNPFLGVRGAGARTKEPLNIWNKSIEKYEINPKCLEMLSRLSAMRSYFLLSTIKKKVVSGAC
jgi:hypothetical protein